MTAVRGAGLTVVWALATGLLWQPGPAQLPPVAREALALLPLLVPWLAAGSLLERYGHRRSLPLIAVGAVAGFLLVSSVV